MKFIKKLVNDLRCLQKFMVAILISWSLIFCLHPVIEAACMAMTKSVEEKFLTISVLGVGNEQASEIWLANERSAAYPCMLEDTIFHSNIKGLCEYRLAAEYGYGYNFLISYGENIGTVLRIPYLQNTKGALVVFCHPGGGIFELKADGLGTQTIDTYAKEGMIKEIQLPTSQGFDIVAFLFPLLLWSAGTWFLYTFMERSVEKRVVPHTTAIISSAQGQKDVSISLLRTISAFLVVYVHSFLNGNYYNTPLTGGTMFVITFLRWLALCCVPLFMLLSGYLCIQRSSLKRSYFSLVPSLLSFAIIMGIHLLLTQFVWKVSVTLAYAKQIFVGMDLAWYLEMYIGLTLLQPFMNLMWSKLHHSQKSWLVLVLLLLTSVGSISKGLLPTYWECLYPLTYYFIGAWFRESPFIVKRLYALIGLFFVLLSETVLTFADANGGIFSWATLGGYECSYNAAPVVLATVLIFLLFKGVSLRSELLQKSIETIGNQTLGIYLTSVAITDTLIYSLIIPHFPTPQAFLPIQIPTALASFLMALLIAMPINKAVRRIWNSLINKIDL